MFLLLTLSLSGSSYVDIITLNLLSNGSLYLDKVVPKVNIALVYYMNLTGLKGVS